MAMWNTFGDYLDSIRLETAALTQVCGYIASSGTGDSFLKASHLTRTRHAHQVTILALLSKLRTAGCFSSRLRDRTMRALRIHQHSENGWLAGPEQARLLQEFGKDFIPEVVYQQKYHEEGFKTFKEQANNLIQSHQWEGQSISFDGTNELLMLDTRNMSGDESVCEDSPYCGSIGQGGAI